MTNQQTLTKAIEKAIAGGWKPLPNINLGEVWEILDWFEGNANDFIWSHDFAKALWGVGVISYGVSINNGPMQHESVQPNWQYHLQQLVIADDVFKYLQENI